MFGFELSSDGSLSDILCTRLGTAFEPTPESIANDEHKLAMEGKEVFKVAVRKLSKVTKNILNRFEVSKEDIKFYVSHQANERILSAMAKNLGVGMDQVPINVQKYGNTSAATVPILLAEIESEGKLNKGDLILVNALGGGITWGGGLIRW